MTNLAIKAWVFNPELKNMVVRVFGIDEEGDKVDVKGIVTAVQGDEITVKNIYTNVKFSFPLFIFGEPDGLKLEAWDAGPSPLDIPPEWSDEWETGGFGEEA